MTITVSRVTFEDRGQEFRWWEIDLETGRIVGCGPMQADIWASGRCSVDVATLSVGERPIFFGPATEPEGRHLRYEIVGIQAVTGKDGDTVWGIDLGRGVAHD